jgi:hypothetical protein
MSKGLQTKLDEVQKAVDSAGKALEEARIAFDAALAKLALPPPVRRKKLREGKSPAG